MNEQISTSEILYFKCSTLDKQRITFRYEVLIISMCMSQQYFKCAAKAMCQCEYKINLVEIDSNKRIFLYTEITF